MSGFGVARTPSCQLDVRKPDSVSPQGKALQIGQYTLEHIQRENLQWFGFDGRLGIGRGPLRCGNCVFPRLVMYAPVPVHFPAVFQLQFGMPAPTASSY